MLKQNRILETNFYSFYDEFNNIIKEANILNMAPRYLGGALRRGFSDGGRMGQALTVAGTGIPGAIELSSDQDPTGKGRSKAERMANIAGGAVGGLSGQAIGGDIANFVHDQIDGSDRFKIRADARIGEDIKNMPYPTNRELKKSMVRDDLGKLVESPTTREMQAVRAEKELAQSVHKGQMKSRSLSYKPVGGSGIGSTVVKPTFLGRAGYLGGRAALKTLPLVAGLGASLYGMNMGEKITSLPFKLFNKNKPQTTSPTQQPIQSPVQPV